MSKVQEASIILRVSFPMSKWPHLNRAFLVTLLFHLILAVCECNLKRLKIFSVLFFLFSSFTFKVHNCVWLSFPITVTSQMKDVKRMSTFNILTAQGRKWWVSAMFATLGLTYESRVSVFWISDCHFLMNIMY